MVGGWVTTGLGSSVAVAVGSGVDVAGIGVGGNAAAVCVNIVLASCAATVPTMSTVGTGVAAGAQAGVSSRLAAIKPINAVREIIGFIFFSEQVWVRTGILHHSHAVIVD
jgi:hypothetical protein